MTQSRYSQTQVGTPNQSTRASSATGSLPTLDDLLGPRKRDDSEEESGTVSESEVFEDDGIQNAVNSDSKVDDGQDSEPVNSKSRIGKNAEKRGAREAVNGTRGRGSGEREDSRAEKSGDLDAEDADGESYVTLMSSDGFSFVVRKSAAVRSEVIMRMLDRTSE